MLHAPGGWFREFFSLSEAATEVIYVTNRTASNRYLYKKIKYANS